MRAEIHPQTPVYESAAKDKQIASFMLLPLIEFEFAFNGSQKPVITQSERNIQQLKVLFRICRNHGWTASEKIAPLGKKDEYFFKLSNRGFKEIYGLAGPMADGSKDEWARLLCERADNVVKDMKTKDTILKSLQKSGNGLSVLDICLKTRRLPYTVTRHLKNLERAKMIARKNALWYARKSASTPANSPS